MQEAYRSETREAGKRTRQLRKLGITARSESLGWQVLDPDGPNERMVKVTLVTIQEDGKAVPAPDFTPTKI